MLGSLVVERVGRIGCRLRGEAEAAKQALQAALEGLDAATKQGQTASKEAEQESARADSAVSRLQEATALVEALTRQRNDMASTAANKDQKLEVSAPASPSLPLFPPPPPPAGGGSVWKGGSSTWQSCQPRQGPPSTHVCTGACVHECVRLHTCEGVSS